MKMGSAAKSRSRSTFRINIYIFQMIYTGYGLICINRDFSTNWELEEDGSKLKENAFSE